MMQWWAVLERTVQGTQKPQEESYSPTGDWGTAYGQAVSLTLELWLGHLSGEGSTDSCTASRGRGWLEGRFPRLLSVVLSLYPRVTEPGHASPYFLVAAPWCPPS